MKKNFLKHLMLNAYWLFKLIFLDSKQNIQAGVIHAIIFS